MITLDLKGREKIYDTTVGILMDVVNNGLESYFSDIFIYISPYLAYITDITLAGVTSTNSSPNHDCWHIPNRTRCLK